MDVGQTIRLFQKEWSPERVARADRATVYAVATAARLGRDDLAKVRLEASTEDETDPLVRLARWFDAATYPLPAPMRPAEALEHLEGLFAAELVSAFREVQPLIQPVGLE